VNGAVIAEKIYLNRSLGNYRNPTVGVPENADDNDIAEVFNFSPELYMALMVQGRSNVNGKFDSILSLPPSF
jgi:hypothetical protein